jgi:hypothetical protein
VYKARKLEQTTTPSALQVEAATVAEDPYLARVRDLVEKS